MTDINIGKRVCRARILLIALFLLYSGQAQTTKFIEVGAAVGIQQHYQHSRLWGGGVSFFDYDMDGFADLTFANGLGQPLRIFQNDQTGSFVEQTSQANLLQQVETKSIIWADFDNDGDQDLLSVGYYDLTRLFRQDAAFVFTDITANVGLSLDTLQTSPACWFDFDNDGFLDLYICNRNITQPNRLYHNQNGQSFVDVTGTAGVGDTARAPLAVVALDYDNDGWQDIYIANDRGAGNTLFRNNGDGTFANVSAAANADLKFDAMGIAVGDYNDDGWMDMYVSNGPVGNGLLHNNGDGTFTDFADSLGLLVNKICWGVSFIDYDNDSDLDLFACVSGGIGSIANVLFENLGNGTFSQAQATGFEGFERPSFSQAVGDFNNDGYCDIVVVNEDSLSTVWKNSGTGNNWLKIDLTGTISNRDAVGAIVEIHKEGQTFIRSKHCGTSYLAQDDRQILVGMGNSMVADSIIVRWPSGNKDVAIAQGVNKVVSFVEGQGATAIDSNTSLPKDFVLLGNYPNPFNPLTTIKFTVIGAGRGTFVVYDITGRQVYAASPRLWLPGEHTITWNGINSAGKQVSSGTYFFRLTIDRTSADGKMVLLR